MTTTANGFLYFFPGVTGKPDTDLIAECGLADVFDGPSFADGMRGPSETVGSMCTRSALPIGFDNGYRPDEQTWAECAGGKFWLGFYTDKPPGPVDLERENPVDGYPLKVIGGADWIIPAAILHGDRPTCLPRSIHLDANGERVHRHLPQYAEIERYAASVLDYFKFAWFGDGEQPTVDEQFLWDAAVAALATNYSVSQWEVGALGILSDTTDHSPQKLLSLLVDLPAYLRMRNAADEAAKKNSVLPIQDTSNSTDGSEGSHPDTDQPSPTSSCSEASN